MKQKYLFLYINAGAGHYSSAKSITDSIVQNYGETIEPVMVDGLQKSQKWLKRVIVDGYQSGQSKARFVLSFLYALHKINFFARASINLVSLLIKEKIREEIRTLQPQKIVIFHFFLSKPVYEILKEEKLTIPVVTIVTDPFTAPKLWFLNEQQHFVVFSQELAQYVNTHNIPQKKLHIFPYIINDKYKTPLPAKNIDELKLLYGFTPGKKMILILGGGDGMPKSKKIVRNLLKSNLNAEFAIVCGKNQTLYESMRQLKENHHEYRIAVYGFVNFVYELLNICDVVITKGGPATIMEILMLGKIPIITNYIWEQEKGNVDFVLKNKVGIYETNLQRLPQIVNPILYNSKTSDDLQFNIKNLRLENGTPKVSTFLKDFNEIEVLV